jgi:hypothetical protein
MRSALEKAGETEQALTTMTEFNTEMKQRLRKLENVEKDVETYSAQVATLEAEIASVRNGVSYMPMIRIAHIAPASQEGFWYFHTSRATKPRVPITSLAERSYSRLGAQTPVIIRRVRCRRNKDARVQPPHQGALGGEHEVPRQREGSPGGDQAAQGGEAEVFSWKIGFEVPVLTGFTGGQIAGRDDRSGPGRWWGKLRA